MVDPVTGDIRAKRVLTVIDNDGKPHSECVTETYVRDRWILDEPKSLASAGAEFEAWKSTYNAAMEAERDSLKIDLATAQESLTKAESARDEAVAKTASLQSLADQVPGLQVEVERLNALVPPPVGPRQITRREFSALFDSKAPGKMRATWDSDSDIAFQVCLALFTWDGLIDLDSPLLAQMLGGLAQAGLLTVDEMSAIIAGDA